MGLGSGLAFWCGIDTEEEKDRERAGARGREREGEEMERRGGGEGRGREGVRGGGERGGKGERRGRGGREGGIHGPGLEEDREDRLKIRSDLLKFSSIARAAAEHGAAPKQQDPVSQLG